MRTALGFRAHSGGAALVAVAGTIDAPQILERRRIVIADCKQPYHAAAPRPRYSCAFQKYATVAAFQALA